MRDWLDKNNKLVTVGLVLFIALGGIVLMFQQQNDKTASTQNSFKAEQQNWQREKDEMSSQIGNLQKQIGEIQTQKTAAAIPTGSQELGAGSGPTGVATSSAISGVVNINTADAAAFDTLPGIGPSKAAAIIEYRTAHGAFKKTSDLKNVKGIGDATFEKLKARISI